MPLQTRNFTAESVDRDVQVSFGRQPLMTLSPDEADRLAAELAASAAMARAVRQVEGAF